MALLINDMLNDVSMVLIQPVVDTTLGTAVIAPGLQAVTPPSMTGIYVGAVLQVGGLAGEVLTVTATTPTTFTANFTKAYGVGATVQGATFPVGVEVAEQEFTQTEMLQYFLRAQNELLLRTRPVVNIGAVNLTAGTKNYAAPADAIRMERISVAGLALKNVSQDDLSILGLAVPASTNPSRWYQDKVNFQQFGVTPAPRGNIASSVWYEQSMPTAASAFVAPLVPDPLAFIVKYGVLALAFDKDGQFKDPMRSRFAKQIFEFGVLAVSAFVEGVSPGLQQSLEQQGGQR